MVVLIGVPPPDLIGADSVAFHHTDAKRMPHGERAVESYRKTIEIQGLR
jgi:hypothetical protein